MSNSATATLEEITKRYAELIYAVSKKYPGESRHQTALRYIQQAERRDAVSCESGQQSVTPPS